MYPLSLSLSLSEKYLFEYDVTVGVIDLQVTLVHNSALHGLELCQGLGIQVLVRQQPVMSPSISRNNGSGTGSPAAGYVSIYIKK